MGTPAAAAAGSADGRSHTRWGEEPAAAVAGSRRASAWASLRRAKRALGQGKEGKDWPAGWEGSERLGERKEQIVEARWFER